ncbi:MAG: 3-hydroxyacyl-ACP dehydratase FabZ [Deltaproteobacteria bacterium]|nr:3-hydroxyacyl-ACP dehydratase FabZ [Deltaproteobacteria bacterium]
MDSNLPLAKLILPHQEPFLFIDEVLICKEDYVVAVRTFRIEEDFFAGHFPGRPIVPGVLLIEGMAQTFAYWGLRNKRSKAVYLTGIDRARFRKPVLPGDQVQFEVHVESSHMGLVSASAKAKVNSSRVAEACLTGRFEQIQN